jgi:hypothetical protein
VNKKNINTIALLEERVNLLEKTLPEPKTDILFCQVCEYPADDLYSLGEHVGEFHSEKMVEDMDCISCNVSLPSQDILPKHKANNHNAEA